MRAERDWWRPSEVARILHVGRGRVAAMIQAQELPCVHLSPRNQRIPRADFDRWMQDRKSSAASHAPAGQASVSESLQQVIREAVRAEVRSAVQEFLGGKLATRPSRRTPPGRQGGGDAQGIAGPASSALVALGYKASEAKVAVEAAIHGAEPGWSTEQVLKRALLLLKRD